jgi:hypothetical protein
MNDVQFAGRYQCLLIRYSRLLISLQNEQSTVYTNLYVTALDTVIPRKFYLVHFDVQ